jgi:ATP-dependent helicase/nuclease subunit A
VLYSALQRTEAGAFFAFGAKPQETKVSDLPWLIRVWDGAADNDTHIPVEQETEKEVLSSEILEKIQRQLSFQYAHTAATVTPSKQTATQRKGRVKDQEASEQAAQAKHIHRAWRKPEFIARTQSGTTYGSAVHAVLQYIRYEACTDADSVKAEIRRLVEENFITPEQGAMVDHTALAKFFQTPLGRKLCTGDHVLREFKFSILDDASQYGDGLVGEHVLLQGVVDCALVESDGITVVDFKTDYVTKDTIDEITERYRPQVETYADALRRIFELPIKEKALYYFHIGQFCWL